MNISHVAGVDEAGRGPLAGPVSIGVVVVERGYDFSDFPEIFNVKGGIRDSKQLSEEVREVLYERLRSLEKESILMVRTTLVGAEHIDTKGISRCIQAGIGKTLQKTECVPGHTSVLLDGLLRAPEAFIYQETITGGDAKEPAIALASIAAKVRRDRYMRNIAKRYPEYFFEKHKGYGTRVHRECISKFGVSPIHRKTYVKG